MACSRYEYVKAFEENPSLLKNVWIVIRVDGRGFTEFCSQHNYEKPNDHRGLGLMNRCAVEVMRQFGDIQLAYGHSDEYSFVFRRKTDLWNRRHQKLLSTLTSLFSSAFVYYWPEYFKDSERLNYPPVFDGRVVCYPTDRNLRDYLSWRQVDCHVNNQYNVCFWNLVQKKGLSPNQAFEQLQRTQTAEKNELLFTEFSINYNTLPLIDRKGTLLLRIPKDALESTSAVRDRRQAVSFPWMPSTVFLMHTDLIQDAFWAEFSFLLTPNDERYELIQATMNTSGRRTFQRAISFGRG